MLVMKLSMYAATSAATSAGSHHRRRLSFQCPQVQGLAAIKGIEPR